MFLFLCLLGHVESEVELQLSVFYKGLEQDVLCVTVFERDQFSPDDFLGRTEIRLAEIKKDQGSKGPITKRLLLHEVPTGEIVVRLDLQLFEEPVFTGSCAELYGGHKLHCTASNLQTEINHAGHTSRRLTQPAVDVSKLLEQIFSYRRPGSTPPAAQARPTTPPTTTSNVPNSSKREPAVSPASSTTKQVSDDLSKVTVPASSTTSAALASNTSAIESQTLTEAKETKEETVTVLLSSAHSQENMEASSFAALTVETLIETALKSVEPEISPVETLEVRPAFAEGAIDAPAEKVTDSEVSYTTKEELILETTESSVEIINSPVETLETGAAVAETSIETTQKVETNTTDLGFGNLSHTTEEKPLIETLESPVEANHVALESLDTIPHVVEGPVEPTIDVTSPILNILHTDKDHTLIETVEPQVETSHFPVETLETEAAVLEHPVQSAIDVTHQRRTFNRKIEPVAAILFPFEPIETKAADAEGSVEATVETEAEKATLEMQTNSIDLGLVNLSHTTKEEPLIETIEAHDLSLETLETEAAVSEHPVETTVDVTAQVED
ncbi:hypothetical protein F7725_023699 [Dissostichus mawsoni]|uniref:C2 domain-containing protein n=1 Tax=Dissostichus mawsoni TaxID=36200 RepID=A0A7J5Y051_DISMA|nr:hypothetical protein F7725_023699 [Dissostichus mawsoni]